jgi:peptidoglycan lytic transglycosylase
MKKYIILFLFLAFAGIVAGCSASGSVSGKVYKKNVEASYYADKFNGRKTASGETFSNSKRTAAHRKLPFGTKVKVTNLANNESVIVEINDRGPHKSGRELDLSKRAFMEITDNKNHGTLRITMEIL